MASGNWHAVAQEADLADGQARAVRIAEHSLLLVRDGKSVYAIADRCSHADEELACGIVRNGWIACPAHGARFDLATGEPLNPPAREPIRTYPVRTDDGALEVFLPFGR